MEININKIQAKYKQQCQEAENEQKRLQRNINRVSLLRLLVFVGGIAVIVSCREEGWPIVVGIILLVLLAFIRLVAVHTRLFHRKEYQEVKARVNREELQALDYDASHFDDGREFIDPSHYYTFDLDVFGPNSLFQYMNRTSTEPGRKQLAAWFIKHLQAPNEIKERQEAVKELSRAMDFCQEFRILGLLYKGQRADESELKAWAESATIFRKQAIFRLLPPMVMTINAICLLCTVTGILSGAVYGGIWTLIVAFSFIFTGRITRLQAVYGKKLQILSTYAMLLQHMDGQQLQSTLLKGIKQQIGGERQQASQAIHRLSRLMSELDQRNNMFMYAILNGFFFWEVWQMMRIEAWKEQYAKLLPNWVEAIGEMDALCSLATFTYNHPEASFPVLLQKKERGGFVFRGNGLGHPLINRACCVRNDIDMQGELHFAIITGANMAGKSTYLRTVGTNFLLACIGAPVCADQLELTPVQLITSLRTSDSLTENESYFFAELKRLKLVIDLLQKGNELFIILDEILKGTNSMDKQKGSMALIRQFIALKTHGIIATHDLLLGTLIESFPQEVRNFCFEADIKDNELTFAYQMRPGVAQNMNACFLMKKMGIAITD